MMDATLVFASDARIFLTATQNAAWGFFVRDREEGVTTRLGLSRGAAGWIRPEAPREHCGEECGAQ